MRISQRNFRNFLTHILRYLAVVLVIALVKLFLQPFEAILGIQTIALFYLLPVMLSSVLWGLWPGVLASLVAFLTFNYYYIQPYHTLMVLYTLDLITLIIFLIVAVVMSQLIGQASGGVNLARSREWEATRMYELISALAGLQETAGIARTLAGLTLETFRFDRVEVSIAARGGEPPFSTASSSGTASTSGAATEEGIGVPNTADMCLPLLTARGTEGEMCIWHPRGPLSEQELRLLEAYTSQGALALERIRLAKGENKSRVLEESNRMKTALLNSVSHELRSPLAAIKASVSSLRTGAVNWDTAARQELLATVEEETDHLNLLVGNLLDMSRIESGALKPQRRWNAISEIAMGVVTKMRKQLGGHQLQLDFPDHLPLVPTDYVMIEQVFTNLLSNSIKYAPPQTIISVSARQEVDSLHVQVANQGPSVPEAHLERIFDKFYRVTEADRVTGTGLGLSICKGIIEEHGGRIWAENQPNFFVFHFLLPLALDGAFPETPKEARDG